MAFLDRFEMEQMENGNWIWTVQLHDDPNYFQVGISATELDGMREAQATINMLHKMKADWSFG